MEPDHTDLGMKKGSNLISTTIAKTTINPSNADGILSWNDKNHWIEYIVWKGEMANNIIFGEKG